MSFKGTPILKKKKKKSRILGCSTVSIVEMSQIRVLPAVSQNLTVLGICARGVMWWRKSCDSDCSGHAFRLQHSIFCHLNLHSLSAHPWGLLMKAGLYSVWHYQLATFHIRATSSLERRTEIGLIDLVSNQQSFPIDLRFPRGPFIFIFFFFVDTKSRALT